MGMRQWRVERMESEGRFARGLSLSGWETLGSQMEWRDLL